MGLAAAGHAAPSPPAHKRPAHGLMASAAMIAQQATASTTRGRGQALPIAGTGSQLDRGRQPPAPGQSSPRRPARKRNRIAGTRYPMWTTGPNSAPTSRKSAFPHQRPRVLMAPLADQTASRQADRHPKAARFSAPTPLPFPADRAPPVRCRLAPGLDRLAPGPARPLGAFRTQVRPSNLMSAPPGPPRMAMSPHPRAWQRLRACPAHKRRHRRDRIPASDPPAASAPPGHDRPTGSVAPGRAHRNRPVTPGRRRHWTTTRLRAPRSPPLTHRTAVRTGHGARPAPIQGRTAVLSQPRGAPAAWPNQRCSTRPSRLVRRP